MFVAAKPVEVRPHVMEARNRGERIGVVPTMGALHAGHLSLIESAVRECGFVVVTIFVNPTQFGPGEDFEQYPRPIEDDLDACRTAGVALVYHPPAAAMYPQDFATYVEVEGLCRVLEGAFRPTHFRGVTTVVLKLFNAVGPDVAYFGRKDYQQQLIIRRMCRDLDLPVEIRTCDIVRESDGLALSSRNVYLSATERQTALALSQSLELAEEHLKTGETDVESVRTAMHTHMTEAGVDVDYATIADPHTLVEIATPAPEMVALVAGRVGKTRLIDNTVIRP